MDDLTQGPVSHGQPAAGATAMCESVMDRWERAVELLDQYEERKLESGEK